MQFLLLCAALLPVGWQSSSTRDIDIALWYNGPGNQPAGAVKPASDDELRRDLVAIRRAGFNAIVTWKAPHQQALARLASEEGLQVALVDPTTAVNQHEPIVIRTWPGPSAREARLALWDALVKGVRRISFIDADGPLTRNALAVGETAGVVTRNQALFAPLAPRDVRGRGVKVVPAGPVAVFVLESSDAIAIVALNRSHETRRVKMTFPPEVPEAIWQNMEAGNAVNFVMEKDGPGYEHTFSPYDALVLAIRKTLR